MDKFFKKNNEETPKVRRTEINEEELAQIMADKSTVSHGSGRSYK